MTAAWITASIGGKMSKKMRSARKLLANVRAIGSSVPTPGPKSGTSREAGVTNTASSVPRSCSCRSAVPAPQGAAGERQEDLLERHRDDLDVTNGRGGGARRVERRGNEVAGGCAMRGHGQGAVRPLASRDRRAALESIDHRALVAVKTDLQVN